MSGGVAYVLDEIGDFASRRLNGAIVSIEEIDCEGRSRAARADEQHCLRTGSSVARRVLDDWDAMLPRFAKVMPNDLPDAF